MKPIHTYQSLGRYIINTIYSELLKNYGIMGYDSLKKAVYKKCIKQNIFVDQSFATYEYEHKENSLTCPHTYRWEAVMDFYIGQQIKASLLKKRISFDNDFSDEICLTRNTYNKLLNSSAVANGLFDDARIILRQKYEEQLNKQRLNKWCGRTL